MAVEVIEEQEKKGANTFKKGIIAVVKLGLYYAHPRIFLSPYSMRQITQAGSCTIVGLKKPK